MKKTIVFVLVMALCVTALSSCAFIQNLLPGNNGDDGIVSPVTIVANMYKMSSPTKIVATTKQSISSLELNCSYELVTGYVDNRPASVYTVNTEEIRTVEDGGNTDEVKDIIKKTTRKTTKKAPVTTTVVPSIAPEVVEAVVGHEENTNYEKCALGEALPYYLL